MSKSISEQENELFNRWKVIRPRLVEDGAIDGAAYLESSPRIVLVLKDVNDEGGSGGWDLREGLKSGGRWQTWGTVTRWLSGLRQLDRDLSWEELCQKPTESDRAVALRSLSVVNLKKEPGGPSSDRDAVSRYAHEDAEFLREQIALYDAELIVCGGVGRLFGSVMGASDWRRTARGVAYFQLDDGCHVVDYYHPQARIAMNLLHYTLMDAVREIKGVTPKA